MNRGDDQDLQVKKDLQYLTRILTADNLDIEVMFSPKRGSGPALPRLNRLPLAGCLSGSACVASARRRNDHLSCCFTDE